MRVKCSFSFLTEMSRVVNEGGHKYNCLKMIKIANLIIHFTVQGTSASPVFVRSHWRVRNGKRIFVKAHWRKR